MMQSRETRHEDLPWLFGSLSGLFRQPFDAALTVPNHPPPVHARCAQPVLPHRIRGRESHRQVAADGTGLQPQMRRPARPVPDRRFFHQTGGQHLQRYRQRLSGGQKQRITIARALLKRPQILVFDEAVFNLDSQTVEHFAKTINQIKEKVTMLFIAHQIPRGLQIAEIV